MGMNPKNKQQRSHIPEGLRKIPFQVKVSEWRRLHFPYGVIIKLKPSQATILQVDVQ